MTSVPRIHWEAPAALGVLAQVSLSLQEEEGRAPYGGAVTCVS